MLLCFYTLHWTHPPFIHDFCVPQFSFFSRLSGNSFAAFLQLLSLPVQHTLVAYNFFAFAKQVCSFSLSLPTVFMLGFRLTYFRFADTLLRLCFSYLLVSGCIITPYAVIVNRFFTLFEKFLHFLQVLRICLPCGHETAANGQDKRARRPLFQKKAAVP